MTYYVVRDDEGPWITEQEPASEDEIILTTEDQAEAEACLTRECQAEEPDNDDDVCGLCGNPYGPGGCDGYCDCPD